MEFRFLDIFRNREKSRTGMPEKIQIALGESDEFIEICFEIGATVIGVCVNLRNAIDPPILAQLRPPPEPVGQQRTERVTINEKPNPRMMTLVAALGLLSTAMSHGIGPIRSGHLLS
jgi:hypothetical protein